MKYFMMAFFAGLLAMSSPSFGNTVNPEVEKAQVYLQNLKTATADFIQTSSLGSRLSGQFYLDRPGKLRFNYNEIKDFIVADGVFVYYYDAQLEQQSNAPIGQTLADFLLREDLRLDGDLKVVKSYKKDGLVFIDIVQRDEPEAGQIELIFTELPYALSKWKITDAQGEITEVTLKNLKTGMEFTDIALFGYNDPKGRKAVND